MNRPQILVVNDDGIEAEGIRILAENAARLGDVWVTAPDRQCSAMSQRISIFDPLVIRRTEFPAEVRAAWSVGGTPADCVKAALNHLLPVRPDLVFSGINNGFNLGHDIAYSGTCGAAFEANYAGIKAVSFSTIRGNTKKASEYLPAVWSFIIGNGLLEYSGMLNVNIPEEPKGILVTEQGRTFFRDHFVDAGENMYKAAVYLTRSVDGPLDLKYDTDAVLAGYCSVTPLLTNRTDHDALKKISERIKK